jgi:5-methylcytosine-specific restriction endonuclease McrA
MSYHHPRKVKMRARFKQAKLNAKLKRRLYGHLFMAPCCYCKKVFLVTSLTIEHLVPLCLGGSSDVTNIALSCAPCNQEKGREAWLMKRKLNRSQYEQHPHQHRKQDRSNTLQDSGTSDRHS